MIKPDRIFVFIPDGLTYSNRVAGDIAGLVSEGSGTVAKTLTILEDTFTALESIIGSMKQFNPLQMATDELQKLTQEFSKMTRRERASIAKAMLEGAVKYARRKKKATLRSARHN